MHTTVRPDNDSQDMRRLFDQLKVIDTRFNVPARDPEAEASVLAHRSFYAGWETHSDDPFIKDIIARFDASDWIDTLDKITAYASMFARKDAAVYWSATSALWAALPLLASEISTASVLDRVGASLSVPSDVAYADLARANGNADDLSPTLGSGHWDRHAWDGFIELGLRIRLAPGDSTGTPRKEYLLALPEMTETVADSGYPGLPASWKERMMRAIIERYSGKDAD